VKHSTRVLHDKSLSSMRTAMTAFNSPHDDGRTTSVLLHLQHSFEMLLKAALTQAGGPVFDKRTGRSISFEHSVRQAQQLRGLKLTGEEAGTLRAVDAMRDDEQHWFTQVSEGLLYLHARACVTLFDDVLFRAFSERLADHLPTRVLPMSTEPPQDLQTLVDREYTYIAELLRPGRRARAEARARIRSLLALEAHVDEDVKVSDSDVRRVEKGLKDGKVRDQVFPRLGQVGATVSGEGLSVEVRFVKVGGMPVRLVKAEEPVDASAFRLVDLQRKYHRAPADLAEQLKITYPRSSALREHLGIDDDESCYHVFDFGGAQRIRRYSDNAFTRMRDALKNLDLDAVWASHGKVRTRKPRPTCTQPGCALLSPPHRKAVS
jgi:hypothetical protein